MKEDVTISIEPEIRGIMDIRDSLQDEIIALDKTEENKRIAEERRNLERLDAKQFTIEEEKIVKAVYGDLLIYTAGMKEVQTKFEILREDFKTCNAYNPIEHIKVRVKSPESLMKKVYMRKIPLEYEKVKENINDIAGIRVVCTFKSDIYKIAEILSKSEDLKIIEVKDYISNPKVSGYQSYHMIVEVPVYLAKGKEICKVEIQLRTMAMDFWASLEHKIKYKYDWLVPDSIKEELKECSEIVDNLDEKMQSLHLKVHNPYEKQIESNL